MKVKIKVNADDIVTAMIDNPTFGFEVLAGLTDQLEPRMHDEELVKFVAEGYSRTDFGHVNIIAFLHDLADEIEKRDEMK